ncbi:MAG: 50S ribosomal protein L4 [Methylococcaceae bacterium]|jgi:large subunit ribosomal protein L4|nr:50S ribosomal protein L4 [Methylococcaceae bacterium]MDZ4157094.1 50S ribosomal protein L4 [Methylococcales bacterium]MDP2394151.1 50S ribosomal protein L4 [Methylococcaceae bacterium]MDP3019979.1 50S ribosomal protein L4 [Methylococcaceae bacterium]MDP3388721.1 50S ribosomal protein L4 [Methylococcaceae bacterium]
MGLQIPALSIKDLSVVSTVVASDEIFGKPFNETLVHQLVTKYLAGSRAGTKAQKTRSDVSGGGAKPWRQKGTGRARSGTTRSPVWRTGGVAFAARPRNYDQKLNRKMFRAGLVSILSELLRQERLVVIDALNLDTSKTKDLNLQIQKFESNRSILIVTLIDEKLALASRNITSLNVLEVNNLNPVLLVGADKVIITRDALIQLEERLA